ncbi:uncharacterized protein LOC129003556 [Macrosteles quadrilineatus]|uniref:uncharacterized protein LOC129003556 n=1 Tax=Macrosteles quadrilineatus TaxID=74068 RepID=UPI0023E305E0|nr:uncharacterized protein LOC129003556 [Macrosteles quadrilineatus]
MANVSIPLSDSDEKFILQALEVSHPNLRLESVTGTAAVEDGANMMGVVSRVKVLGCDLDTGLKMDLSLIMKRLPESMERRELFLCDAAFQNEANFYREVAPRLGDHTELPFPRSLLAADDVIVLQDLRQEGFTMADRRSGMDLDHCLIVMQELGRYHAVSYAMKHLRPDEFKKVSSSVKEVFIHKGNTLLIGCIDHCVGMALKAAKDQDATVIERLKSYLGKGIDSLTPHVIPYEPLAVICHGDFHSNNILFRYTENNNKPIQAAFVDLQGCRYASPAIDILYFIFSSSSSDVLKNHFVSLVSTYQNSLESHLGNIAPFAEIPSLDEVMCEVRKRLDYGLVMSLLMLPMVSADKVTFDLNKVSEETMSEVQQNVEKNMVNEEYHRRVNDLLLLIAKENLLVC